MKTNFKITILLMSVMLLTSSFFVSCEKDNDTDEPKAVITVTTTSISNITQTSAKSGGDINITGNATIDGKGVCWSTTQSPTIQNSKTADGTGSSPYVSNITSLNGNTTYYVRAYATYSKGIVYGNEISFTTSPNPVLPTVTTNNITTFTQTTAAVGGEVTADCGATVTERGICYSKLLNPTIENANKIQIGSGIGAFSSSLTNLTVNTTYYVRAYAKNSVGVNYGSQVSFTTLPNPVLPTVVTVQVKNITPSSATCVGNVTFNGNSTIIQTGVVYSTQPNPTVKVSSSKSDNLFEIGLTNLKANTTYYVKAYAQNSVGIAYGNEITFTTPSITVGMSYQDGIVGYILKLGDTGYVAGEIHGLLVKSEDQSSGTTWENAKTICSNLGTGWYLPNFTELHNIWTNRSIIGGFISGQYWSSDTDYASGANFAKALSFHDGLNQATYKTYNWVKVRAVKAF